MSLLPPNQQHGYPNPQDQVAFHRKNTAMLLILLNLKSKDPEHFKNTFFLMSNKRPQWISFHFFSALLRG